MCSAVEFIAGQTVTVKAAVGVRTQVVAGVIVLALIHVCRSHQTHIITTQQRTGIPGGAIDIHELGNTRNSSVRGTKPKIHENEITGKQRTQEMRRTVTDCGVCAGWPCGQPESDRR